MDDIYYERVLNRIIQGRLRLRLGDLVLFIEEPSQEILEASYEIYDQYYDKAYFGGVFIEEEILELLINNDLWSPLDEKAAKDYEEKIEELKVQAFKNFYSAKKLFGIKRQLRHTEGLLAGAIHKKKQLNHVTCKGIANFARKSWIISKTTKNEDGSLFDFKKVSISRIMDIYGEHVIDAATFRKIARSQPFRSMWTSSKKRGDVFGKPSSCLDANQLAVCQYSSMYDNVYESPDAPKDKAIEDDDCLDGWFIVQRRKYEKDKKQREIDDMLAGNEKIKNSQEIFLMAQDQEQANEIFDLNDPFARSTIKNRQSTIQNASGDLVHIRDLPDMQQDISIARVASTKAAMGNMNRR